VNKWYSFQHKLAKLESTQLIHGLADYWPTLFLTVFEQTKEYSRKFEAGDSLGEWVTEIVTTWLLYFGSHVKYRLYRN
jgi:hypothetical protein